MVIVSVACGGSDLDRDSPAALRAAAAGRVIAQLGAEHFYSVGDRTGRSGGIVPGVAAGFENAVLGAVTKYNVASKYDPARWIELVIYTHLPGRDPKGPCSRAISST